VMTMLRERRLDAVHAADRWSDAALGVSVGAVVLGGLALVLAAASGMTLRRGGGAS
jgi:hypothetical protein